MTLHLGQYLKEELFTRGIPVRKVAELSGSNVKTVYDHLKKDNLSAKELFAIGALIGVDLNELRKEYSYEEVI